MYVVGSVRPVARSVAEDMDEEIDLTFE